MVSDPINKKDLLGYAMVVHGRNNSGIGIFSCGAAPYIKMTKVGATTTFDIGADDGKLVSFIADPNSSPESGMADMILLKSRYTSIPDDENSMLMNLMLDGFKNGQCEIQE